MSNWGLACAEPGAAAMAAQAPVIRLLAHNRGGHVTAAMMVAI